MEMEGEQGKSLEDFIKEDMTPPIQPPSIILRRNEYRYGSLNFRAPNKSEKKLADGYIELQESLLKELFADLRMDENGPWKSHEKFLNRAPYLDIGEVANKIYNAIDDIIKNRSQFDEQGSKLQKDEIAATGIVVALVAYSYYRQTQDKSEASLKDRAKHILSDKNKIVDSVVSYFRRKDPENYKDNLFEALKKVKLEKYPLQLVLFNQNGQK